MSDGQETVDYPEYTLSEDLWHEERSPWHTHRAAIICDTARRHPFEGGFADVGGGSGYLALMLGRAFADRDCFLVEPGYEACLRARERGVELVYSTAYRDFSFDEKKIGGVGLFDVIEHVEDDAGFLRDLAQQAGPGTRFYITVPAYGWLWSDVDDYSQHHRRYDRGMIQRLADRTGLQVRLNAYFHSYLPPFTFLLRCLPYRLGLTRTPDEILESATQQLEPSGLGAWIFERGGAWERARFGDRGMRFGASCIAVLDR
ncbi:MAG: methyltransferase domain-containing protein [Myxococcota bacterium]